MRLTRLAPATFAAALLLAACTESPVSPLSSSAVADAKGTSTSTTSTSSTTRIRIFANLLPPSGAPYSAAKGKGSWDSRNNNTKRELEVEVEHLPVGLAVEFFVGGVSVGTRTTDAFGYAELEFSTELGESVPTSVNGVTVEVRTAAGAVIVSGAFPTA